MRPLPPLSPRGHARRRPPRQRPAGSGHSGFVVTGPTVTAQASQATSGIAGSVDLRLPTAHHRHRTAFGPSPRTTVVRNPPRTTRQTARQPATPDHAIPMAERPAGGSVQEILDSPARSRSLPIAACRPPRRQPKKALAFLAIATLRHRWYLSRRQWHRKRRGGPPESPVERMGERSPVGWRGC